MSISPGIVGTGQDVYVNVLVTNTGHVSGSHEIILMVDSEEAVRKSVTLTGGSSKLVVFQLSWDAVGMYTLGIGDMSRTVEVVAEGPAPALFTVSDLSITPQSVEGNERVSVGVLVTNASEIEDTYVVVLKIDGVAEETREVTLSGGTSQEVTFAVSRAAAGSYEVSIGELSDEFTVVESAPEIWGKVAEVEALPIEEAQTSPWPIVGIVAGSLLFVVLIGYFLWRRRFA
jgi:hypothetical protein